MIMGWEDSYTARTQCKCRADDMIRKTTWPEGITFRVCAKSHAQKPALKT